MKIDLKQTINSLEGKPLKNGDNKDLTLGEALSNILLQTQEGGKMKLFVLAQKCFTESTLDLDDVDLILLKNSIKASNVYGGSLVLGQIELMFENLK